MRFLGFLLQPIPVVRYYGPILFARTTQGILEGGARAELAKGLFASAHARRLQDDAASSPITEERTNYSVSAGVAYRF